MHGRADSARVRTRGRVRVPHTSVHDSRKLPGSNTTTLSVHSYWGLLLLALHSD